MQSDFFKVMDTTMIEDHPDVLTPADQIIWAKNQLAQWKDGKTTKELLAWNEQCDQEQEYNKVEAPDYEPATW